MDDTNNLSCLERAIKDMENKPYKRNHSKVQNFSQNFSAETIYIGSKKRNAKMFLRIYDKKKEQGG